MCKRGSKVKRLIVELEGLLAVGVENHRWICESSQELIFS